MVCAPPKIEISRKRQIRDEELIQNGLSEDCQLLQSEAHIHKSMMHLSTSVKGHVPIQLARISVSLNGSMACMSMKCTYYIGAGCRSVVPYGAYLVKVADSPELATRKK